MDGVAIRVHQLYKTYRAGMSLLRVLESVSFSVPEEAWATLLGPSGCGKTTLLRILAGLESWDEGEVAVQGAPPRVQATAYLPQHDSLLPWRTVLENAVLASEVDRSPMPQARREAKQLLERFGLAGFDQRYPHQLSGGMRQRLALIRTFLSRRRTLLLDEPLGALDPLTRAEMQDWLLSIWEEFRATVLLVTHDPEEAVLLSDRILVLSPRPATVLREESIPLARPRNRGGQDAVAKRAELLALLLSPDGRRP